MISGLKGSGVKDLTQFLMEQACSLLKISLCLLLCCFMLCVWKERDKSVGFGASE